MLTGSCHCGAVKVEISGAPAVQAFCHCGSCRGWLGAPIHAATLWPTPNVNVVNGADKLAVFKKTEASHRHFCTACGRIQTLPQGADYFTLLELPQKLQIDAAELEKKFHALNWKLHPDNFTNATERERALSVEQSSKINDAYRTLRDPVRRVEYLLQRAGVRKEGTTKQQAPPVTSMSSPVSGTVMHAFSSPTFACT